jgi:hypothetical protein
VRGGGDGWEKIDILDVMEIWDMLDDEIDERCRAEDAKRRRAAGHKGAQPAGGKSAGRLAEVE